MRESVIYLVFNTREEAIEVLGQNEAVFDEWQAHFESPIGWGTIFNIPDKTETFVNLYDGVGDTVVQYIIPAPATPYNTRA